jgi:hypothetical protein
MFLKLTAASTLLAFGMLPTFAAEKAKHAETVTNTEEAQPAVEKLDLNMYARIREEGLRMESAPG